MDFEMFTEFFNNLNVMKKKYPLIVSYNKHISNLKTEQTRQNELELFKHFMIMNQKKMEFEQVEFKTGKPSLSLNMNMFTQVPDFWKKLYELETVLFFQGKPSKEEYQKQKPSESPSATALKILENTPMFSDVVREIKNSSGDIKDINDIGEIMNKPEFGNMVEQIKGGLMCGKYKLSDLTSTLGTIINSVQDELDPNTRATLATVSETMAAVERGEPIDGEKIIGAVSSLKLK